METKFGQVKLLFNFDKLFFFGSVAPALVVSGADRSIVYHYRLFGVVVRVDRFGPFQVPQADGSRGWHFKVLVVELKVFDVDHAVRIRHPIFVDREVKFPILTIFPNWSQVILLHVFVFKILSVIRQ